MHLDDPLHQGQADARSLHGGIETLEQGEHPLVMAGIDPDAVVLHETNGAVRSRAGAHYDRRMILGPHELRGVVHEVLQHLVEARPVPEEHRERPLDLEGGPRGGQPAGQGRAHPLRQGLEGHVLGGVGDPSYPGQVQELAQEALHGGGGGADARHVRRRAVLAAALDVLLQEAEEALHGDERAAQVVGHRVGELFQLRVAPFHLLQEPLALRLHLLGLRDVDTHEGEAQGAVALPDGPGMDQVPAAIASAEGGGLDPEAPRQSGLGHCAQGLPGLLGRVQQLEGRPSEEPPGLVLGEVGKLHHSIPVHREDQHRRPLHEGPPAFEAALQVPDGLLEPARHVVEGFGHHLELVAGVDAKALGVVSAGHFLDALGQGGEGTGEPGPEHEAQERDEQRRQRHQLQGPHHGLPELSFQARMGHVVDRREPVAPPVLEVGHHDLQGAPVVAEGADLRRLHALDRVQPLPGESLGRVRARGLRLHLSRVKDHAAFHVGDEDGCDLRRPAEQVEDELAKLEEAGVKIGIEALAQGRGGEDRELEGGRFQTLPARPPPLEQEITGIGDQDQHQGDSEGEEQARAQAAAPHAHGRGPSAGRRSRGRRARLTGGFQATRRES